MKKKLTKTKGTCTWLKREVSSFSVLVQNQVLCVCIVIIPGTDLAKELSKSDMAKRTRSHQERKRKLKNPYFFVSRTR